MTTWNKKISATALSALMVSPFVAAASSERPNFLIFMADDLMSSELGCYGGVNVETPTIDKLAQEGLMFNNCYASTAMSVPIRASMYTGLFPAKHGAFKNHKLTFDGVESVLDYLPELGYKVGRTGKTHFSSRTKADFDNIVGFTVNCVAQSVPHDASGITDYMTEDDQPFLLYVCSTHPHTPWTWGDPTQFDQEKIVLPETFPDTPEMRKIYADYLAEIKALDVEFASVMQALTASGKLDNTIILFLGEQGAQFPGGKWTLWHPGVNSALIAHYPSKIAQATTTDAIVQYEDILPTIIDMAGGDVIEKLDGKSFKSILYGDATEHREYAYGIHNNIPAGRAYPVRSIRDERYVLIHNLMHTNEFYVNAMHGGNSTVWKQWTGQASVNDDMEFMTNRYLNRPEFEFYDYQNDPSELNNLANDPEHAERIATMRAELERWMAEQGDTGKQLEVPEVANTLVKNGSFEEMKRITPTGVNFEPIDWMHNRAGNAGSSILANASEGLNGSSCLKLGMLMNSDVMNVSSSQTIAVEPATTYTFKCHAYYNGALTSGQAYVLVTYGDKKTELMKFLIPLDNIKTADTNYKDTNTSFINLVTETFDFTTPESVTSVTLGFYSGNILSKKTVSFDEVSLVKNGTTSLGNVMNDTFLRVEDDCLILSDNIASVMLFDLTGTSIPITLQNNRVNITNLPRNTYLVHAHTTCGDAVSHKFIK